MAFCERHRNKLKAVGLCVAALVLCWHWGRFGWTLRVLFPLAVLTLAFPDVIMFGCYFSVFAVSKAVAVVLRKDMLDKRLNDEPTYWRKKEKNVSDYDRCLHPF